jgi:hypothetical protein
MCKYITATIYDHGVKCQPLATVESGGVCQPKRELALTDRVRHISWFEVKYDAWDAVRGVGPMPSIQEMDLNVSCTSCYDLHPLVLD